MTDVQRYIPHRPPMCLIENLHAHSDMQVITTTLVTELSPFFDGDSAHVPAWVGLEYMAQTAAVWIGLRDEAAGRKPEPAFLVSARQYQAHDDGFPSGTTLYIQVDVKLLDDNIVSFAGKIFDDSQRAVADALFTAFRPDDVQAYLKGEKS